MGARAMNEHCRPSRERGFSLIELLVVLGVIVLLAAVATPALFQYLRFFQVKGAAQQLQSDLSRARQTAVGRNVNAGVILLLESASRYRIVLEDSQSAGTRGLPLPSVQAAISAFDAGTPGARQQVLATRDLPSAIQFSAAAPDVLCPGPANAWRAAVRFDRLGTAAPVTGSGTYPAVDAGLALLKDDNAGLLTVCLQDQRRAYVKQQLSVTSGGRIRIDSN